MTGRPFTAREDDAIMAGRRQGIGWDRLAKSLGRHKGALTERYHRVLRHRDEAAGRPQLTRRQQHISQALDARRDGWSDAEDLALLRQRQSGVALAGIARGLGRDEADCLRRCDTLSMIEQFAPSGGNQAEGALADLRAVLEHRSAATCH